MKCERPVRPVSKFEFSKNNADLFVYEGKDMGAHGYQWVCMDAHRRP